MRSTRSVLRASSRLAAACAGLILLVFGVSPLAVKAQETVCAKVKIEIKQELTLERQAFDAQMKINNTTIDGVIENVSVAIEVRDENGTPVLMTDDPNNLNAKFFVRISGKQGINAVDGTGSVGPSTSATIDWLLIPAPGSAGTNPSGKKYLVGATLKYRFGGEDQVLQVSPDVITVKPLPLLTLDYFLTQDVRGDDPLTPEIEPIEPYTLGVRVKNTGFATAQNLKIDSAQPKIVDNQQGLLINFTIKGSYLNDAPAQNTLLLNFGDIPAATSKVGRWVMESSLAGKFTEFTAKFSHADELGGSLTSIMQATNAHFLIRDVRVDLPGRDPVRDFLAQDGDVIRVYESDGLDTLVTDRSGVATLSTGATSAGSVFYQLAMPPTAGFVYVKLPDPYQGKRPLGQVVRSDAKVLLPENAWLSRTRDAQTKQWQYWVNFFDVNTTGSYSTQFEPSISVPHPPALQFVPDTVVQEGKQVSFLVQASSPDGNPVTLSASPLPAGATFTAQNAQAGSANSVFDWTPSKGSAGSYAITYTVSDGSLSARQTATIKVEAAPPPPVPAVPTLVSPLGDARVASYRPTLVIQTGTDTRDPTVKVQFELYADEAMTQLVDAGLVGRGTTTGDAGTTSYSPNLDLNEDTRYWWRARAFDGTSIYSEWVAGKFFVNLVNHPPESFNLTSPAPATEVASLQPTLSWTNSVDADEDAITYSVYVFKDSDLSNVMASATGIAPGEGGSTSWTVDRALVNHATYYWRAVATDSRGAVTLTPARTFVVNTGNTAPTVPTIQAPAVGGQTPASTTTLVVVNSSDAEHDPVTYVFELDAVPTFDSADKQSSGQVAAGTGGTTSWAVTNLAENQRYYWRVKAQDGRAESAWAVGNFLMNAVNDPPPAPTVMNPGNGAWVATVSPSLLVNPVLDPEGDPVHYDFEVYKDAALTQKAASGTSADNGWIVTPPLADRTTYYWRARAADPQNGASAWTPVSAMSVSTGQYIPPTILVTAPATVQEPTVAGGKKTVTIAWEGTDPNIEANIALYYDTTGAAYAGTLIVDGLKQAAGTQAGSHVWDVTALPAGAYYVYATIYDAKGVSKAYAAGTVVIAPAKQAGAIVTDAKKNLHTDSNGKTDSFTVALGSVPTAAVVLPVTSSNSHLSFVAPASLVFTPKNWNVPQTVTITGATNCALDDERSYQVLVGKAATIDPNYIGLSATPLTVKSTGNGDKTTNNPNLQICGYKIVSERQVDSKTWEYALTAELSNSGASVKGVTATLQKMPKGFLSANITLSFGAVARGETVKTSKPFVLRASQPIAHDVLQLGMDFQWKLTTK